VARRFARHAANRLAYNHSGAHWLVWDGTVWTRDESGKGLEQARLFIADERLRAVEPSDLSAMGRIKFLSAVERVSRSDPLLATTSAIWNQNPWFLATPSGTIDLRTGRLHSADPADHISRITAAAPSEQADCPIWLTFLHQATNGNQDFIDFLQRWFGYCLTGVTTEHALLFVYGPGGNGKGVLLQTITGIFGNYAATAAMDTFVSSHGDRHPTDLAMLDGARLVVTTETEEDRAWAEARLKALTGGDPISARFMRCDFFTYIPGFKLAVSGNHRPALRTVDDAVKRRINMVPFFNKPELPDTHLVEALQLEWPGILR
jgi:putative DNA primase/helicase